MNSPSSVGPCTWRRHLKEPKQQKIITIIVLQQGNETIITITDHYKEKKKKKTTCKLLCLFTPLWIFWKLSHFDSPASTDIFHVAKSTLSVSIVIGSFYLRNKLLYERRRNNTMSPSSKVLKLRTHLWEFAGGNIQNIISSGLFGLQT